MEHQHIEEIKRSDFTQMPLMTLVNEVFNKLTMFIDVKESHWDEKEIVKKSDSLLSSLYKRLETETAKGTTLLNMLNLGNNIEVYYNYIRHNINKISTRSLNVLVNKLKLILTQSLFLSKSSDIYQLLNILLYVILTTPEENTEKSLTAINKLFDTVEPKGVSKLINPIGIELIKIDIKAKNKYLNLLTEYHFHSGVVNDNIIKLMIGLMDCSEIGCVYLDMLCVEYVLDFTLYLFCDYLLYYHYLYMNNKRIGKDRGECLQMLERLGKKMVTDIINTHNCICIDKVKVYIMVLMIYERELNVSADFNGCYNKDSKKSFLFKLLEDNKTNNELFMQCLNDIIDIDSSYEMLKQYLTSLTSELDANVHMLLKYKMERIQKYKSKELFECKKPLNVLYMSSLDNVTLNSTDSSNNNNEGLYLHYIPFPKQNWLSNKMYLNMSALIDISNVVQINDIANKKYILSCVLKDVLSLLEVFENHRKLRTKQWFVDAFQYTSICFNMITTFIKDDIYEDIIIDFILMYINIKKDSIQYEWNDILGILSSFSARGKCTSTPNFNAIVSYIETMKYNNQFYGNNFQLQEFISALNSKKFQIFKIILQMEYAERSLDKSIKNIQNLFAAVITTTTNNVNEVSSTNKDSSNERMISVNENVSQIQLKVIYQLIWDIFNDIQTKEEKINESVSSTMKSLGVIKRGLIKNIATLIHLFIIDVEKKHYIYDLLSFVIDLILLCHENTFSIDLLKAIFNQVEQSNSIYTITVSFFLNNLTRTQNYISKLQIMFNVIEDQLRLEMNPQNKSKFVFFTVYIDLLFNSKVLPSYEILNIPIRIKSSQYVPNVTKQFGILNTGVIVDYLLYSLRRLNKRRDEVEGDGEYREEMVRKLQDCFIYLTYGNFLVLKGMNFELFYKTFQEMVMQVLEALQSGVKSGDKKAKEWINNSVKCSMNCITNIAFHLELGNGEKKYTQALSNNDINDNVNNYAKLKMSIINDLFSKLNILADFILNRNTVNDTRNRVDNVNDNVSLSLSKAQNKNSKSLRVFMKILSVLEVYLISIDTKSLQESQHDKMRLILKGTIDICAKMICIVKLFAESLTLRFLAYKFFFMIREVLCLYDDVILKVVFLIVQISQEEHVTKRTRSNVEMAKMFDSEFIEWISNTPLQNVSDEEKKTFKLTQPLFFEMSCDYLINYFLSHAINKDYFYKFFIMIFDELKSKGGESGQEGENNLLNMNHIRKKIFFENVKWCLGSNSIKDNMVKPNYKKYNKNNAYPNFYIDKDTYGLILSYEKDVNDSNKYNINIRTAVANFQYTIGKSISNESDNDNNNNNNNSNNSNVIADDMFVISTLSQINSQVSLQKITIDSNFISLLSSLDALSVYRNVYCKVFYRNISQTTNKPEMVQRNSVSDEFIMFLNALGTFECVKQNKIIITAYDVNNQIQYEYFEKNAHVMFKVDHSVTIIWCNSYSTNYKSELIASVEDYNEFYICIYPTSCSHYVVKVVNASNEDKRAFKKLFLEEVVVFVGERYEMLVNYVSKLVLVLNSLSRLYVFVDKQLNKNQDMLPETYLYALHNYDSLIQRYSQINTIGVKYMKGK